MAGAFSRTRSIGKSCCQKQQPKNPLGCQGKPTQKCRVLLICFNRRGTTVRLPYINSNSLYHFIEVCNIRHLSGILHIHRILRNKETQQNNSQSNLRILLSSLRFFFFFYTIFYCRRTICYGNGTSRCYSASCSNKMIITRWSSS